MLEASVNTVRLHERSGYNEAPNDDTWEFVFETKTRDIVLSNYGEAESKQQLANIDEDIHEDMRRV